MSERTDEAVLIVDAGRPWPVPLLEEITRQGYLVVRVDDAKLLPFFVLAGGVCAILIDVRALDVTELFVLRKCREHAPRTSVVVTSSLATQADLKRALDGGATALLSLPASPRRIGEALRSGAIQDRDQCVKESME